MDQDPRARRRPWRWIVIALAVVVAIAGPLVVYKVARYAPLEQGSTFSTPEGSELTTESDTGEEVIVYHVRYEHGKETSFSFSVRNGGGRTVTIVDLPILHRSRTHELLKVRRAPVSDRIHPDLPSNPLAPFPLRGGEERLITVYGIFSDCEWYSSGTGNGYTDIQVGYRFAWSTKVATIRLPAMIDVLSPPDADCPLPRQTGVARETPTPTPSS